MFVPSDTGVVCFEQCDFVPLLDVALERCLGKENTHTYKHQELAQSKGVCGLYVGTRAGAAEHGYGGRDLAVPGAGRTASKDFLSRASLRQRHWPWVLSRNCSEQFIRSQGKVSFIERSLAICFPQKMGPIGCLLQGQEARSPESWLV